MNRREFLSRSVTALSLFLAVAGTFAAQERAKTSTPGAAADGGVQQDRLAWFREARFGMFIHWGPYSELAGEWKGQRVEVGRNAEWIMKFLKIPAAEYREMARQLIR
jgi:hypothetical protein